jgi:hypothetical protein
MRTWPGVMGLKDFLLARQRIVQIEHQPCPFAQDIFQTHGAVENQFFARLVVQPVGAK